MKLVLVSGLPGARKSVVAKIIAQKIQATILNTDTIRRELFPVTRTYTPEETQKVVEEMETRSQAELEKGHSVIIDSVLSTQHVRDHYESMAKRFSVDYILVLVTADEKIIENRIEARLTEKQDPSEANFLTYLKFKEQFEPPRGEHVVIINSGDIQALEQTINTNSKL